MTKHFIKCIICALFLISFFIAPASANLTNFDASVEDNFIIVTGTTSVGETVDIISMLNTDVKVKDGKYEYELEDVPIPDVNGDETLTFFASNVSDMNISLKVKKLQIWNTTIIANASGVANYTTPSADNSIEFILDQAGISGTILEKPVKVIMIYTTKLVAGSPVNLNIKITGTSEDKDVSIKQAVHRTISTVPEEVTAIEQTAQKDVPEDEGDFSFSIEYDTNGLPAGTYVISAITLNSSESVTVKLKSKKTTDDDKKEKDKEVVDEEDSGNARAYYQFKAAQEKAAQEKEAQEKAAKEKAEQDKVKDDLGKSTKEVIVENESETEFKTTEPASSFKVFLDFLRGIKDFFASLW